MFFPSLYLWPFSLCRSPLGFVQQEVVTLPTHTYCVRKCSLYLLLLTGHQKENGNSPIGNCWAILLVDISKGTLSGVILFKFLTRKRDWAASLFWICWVSLSSFIKCQKLNFCPVREHIKTFFLFLIIACVIHSPSLLSFLLTDWRWCWTSTFGGSIYSKQGKKLVCLIIAQISEHGNGQKKKMHNKCLHSSRFFESASRMVAHFYHKVIEKLGFWIFLIHSSSAPRSSFSSSNYSLMQSV